MAVVLEPGVCGLGTQVGGVVERGHLEKSRNGVERSENLLEFFQTPRFLSLLLFIVPLRGAFPETTSHCQSALEVHINVNYESQLLRFKECYFKQSWNSPMNQSDKTSDVCDWLKQASIKAVISMKNPHLLGVFQRVKMILKNCLLFLMLG